MQYDFPTEINAHAATKKERQKVVKDTFLRCWRAYRDHAWGKDELSPVSGDSKNPFGGWAASLVDNLDTLWIMGLKDEFEEAVKAAVEIDLSRCQIEEINVFETTIRHLGGFLAAYDLSGDVRLLEKAREFGDMLIVAFDTPNRMPITRWDPYESLDMKTQIAPPTVLVAEIGSLCMEFTRLSQVTGDPKWYDAVMRIVRVLDEQQYKTYLPGMWPIMVDAEKMDFTKDKLFTLSAMSDSLYEYFPKMHALLGGVDPIFERLYKGSMDTAIAHNLWRPMVPDGADILISGQVRKHSHEGPPHLDPQGQHLVCFAGGMFALGGKLFDLPAHTDIGAKITNGCIWTYKAMPLGIMPEIFRMLPCESRADCPWNETAWKEGVKAENAGAQEVDVDATIKKKRLPPGFVQISDRRYILRPEAIESVFLLYRMTGVEHLLEDAWEMFTAISNATRTAFANAALRDVTYGKDAAEGGEGVQMDSMESFWMAETLKYFYLVFGEVDAVSLDEWVFNTEAHPFRRPIPG